MLRGTTERGAVRRSHFLDWLKAAPALCRSQAVAFAGAVFFFEARRFSAGGMRSLFFRFGSTMERMNFFSPWSSNLMTTYSSLQERTLPKPNFGCSTWAAAAKAGFVAMD